MDWSVIVLIAVIVILGVAGALIYVGQRMPGQGTDTFVDRLNEFSQSGEAVSLDQIELSQPFTERVLFPFFRRFGEMAAKNTPQNVLLETTRKIELSGMAGSFDAPIF